MNTSARSNRGPVLVSDPLQAATDPGLPTVPRAINPDEATARLNAACGALVAARGPLELRAIRVTRRKPGRRCVIEYDLCFSHDPTGCTNLTLVGKVRAKGADKTTPAVLAALRQAGFGPDSADGIGVPAPHGAIPELAMWLQEKVPGVPATRALRQKDGVALALRIAEALHKLHRAGVRSPRRHDLADELRILHERLPQVRTARPEWTSRLERLLAACDRLGASLPPSPVCCIHRDFYAAHVLVDDSRLWLLDFDLFCEGDPALDAGNFIGHITEESLRSHGHAAALADRETALAERFVALHGTETCHAVRGYTTLTLARHIHISTLFPERARVTELLLELCEQRLGMFL